MDVAMFAIAKDVESDANDMRVFESEPTSRSQRCTNAIMLV
jgi:hypothetical protein